MIPPDFELNSLSIGEKTFYYQDQGQGPVLLLIHGSLCDYRYWKAQIHDLAQYFRVICPSITHYWPHEPSSYSDFSVANHADDLNLLLQALNITETALLGHSRGGAIALDMALNTMSVEISHLILADPGMRTPQSHNQHAHTREQALLLLKSGQVDQAMELFIDAVSNTGTWKKMVRWFKDMVRDNAYTLEGQAVEPAYYLSDEILSQININTLLIGGSDSPEPFPSTLSRLDQLMPTTRYFTIKPASHGMNLTQPHNFNQLIIDFLNK